MISNQGIQILSQWEMAHINLLPEFNGTSSCNLDYFLVQCETFLRNFQKSPETPNAELINTFLFNVVKSKIKGEAQTVLDIETNLSFVSLKEKLIRKYGDARDEHILFREISNCWQLKNENFQEYHDRLNQLLIKYKSSLKLNHHSPILEMKLHEADSKALNAFRAGVLPPYREFLRYTNLTEFSQALRACRDFDNERAYENYMDSLRHTPKSSSTSAPTFEFNQPHMQNTRHNFHIPFNNFSNTQFSPRHHQFYNRPQIQNNQPEPSRPIQTNHPPQNLHQSPLLRNAQKQHPRPFISQNKPYPNPQHVGRIYSPQQHTTPMSGVSTIRGNFNSHSEFNDVPSEFLCLNESEQFEECANEYYNAPHEEEIENTYQDFSSYPTIWEEDLNNICNAPQLPFITLHGLKILIDSGTCNSIMNPSVAHSLFSDYLFNEPFCVQSVHATTIGNDNVQFPIFSEYQINSTVNFRVMQWHKYFDALIGTADFIKLGAKIDYDKNVVTLKNQDIPFYLHSPYTQESQELTKNSRFIPIPVNIKQGDVYIPNFHHEGFYFSDSILHAENFQVLYPTEEQLNLNFEKPVYVEPLESVTIHPIEINSITDNDIKEHLRTQHMNNLEQSAIFKLCSQYSDVFYYPGCDLSFTNAIKHYICATDEDPVYQKNYRYPPQLKEIINKEVEKLLEQGIITHSESPYCNPVWIVPKKLDASGQKKMETCN